MTYRLSDPDFLADPAPVLAQMRAEGPLVTARLPVVGKVRITTSDAAARAALKDPRLMRDPRAATGKSLRRQFWWLPRFMAPMMQTLIVRDDPDHRRLRHLVELAFARATITDLRPRIEALADQLLDATPLGKSVDIEAAYTRQLPFEVISTLLGIPDGFRDQVARGIAPLSHVTNPVRAVGALFRLKGVMRQFRGHFAEVRANPGSGLISELVAARDDAGALSEDELLAMVLTLFLAGHETTVHLINGAILAMLDAPELLDHFRNHPDTRHLMIEEFVRHITPVMMTKLMFVSEDMEFQGVPLKKGEKISAFLLAANHDPTRVETPETMIPDRKPNAHLGFGFGPHVCLGMQLARVETEVALDRLFTRHPEAHLATPRPGWLRRPGLRAPRDLRLHLP